MSISAIKDIKSYSVQEIVKHSLKIAKALISTYNLTELSTIMGNVNL